MNTPIETELLNLYRKCRAKKPFMIIGEDAKVSLRTAKTILRFRQLEADGLVRLRAEPEQESYFDVFEPEGYTNAEGHWVTADQARKEICEVLDRDGVWWTCSEWFDGEEWQQADSCGMHTGYKNPLNPFENCYIVGHMASAIDALESHLADQAKELSESQEMACRDIATIG